MIRQIPGAGIWFLGCLLCLLGCGLFRKTTSSPSVAREISDTLTEEQKARLRQNVEMYLRSAQPSADTLFQLSGRLILTLQMVASSNRGNYWQTDTVQYRFRLLFRWLRDSLFWFSILGPLDVEVFRGWIARDTVVLWSRLEKTAYTTSLQTLGWKHVDSLFQWIQEFLTFVPRDCRPEILSTRGDFRCSRRMMNSWEIVNEYYPVQDSLWGLHKLRVLSLLPGYPEPLFYVEVRESDWIRPVPVALPRKFRGRGFFPEGIMEFSRTHFHFQGEIQSWKWNRKIRVPPIRIPGSFEIIHLDSGNAREMLVAPPPGPSEEQ